MSSGAPATSASRAGLLKFFPGLELLRNYRREWIYPDLLAGLSDNIVMVPSVIAYATLMGLPPQYGLYAALTPLLVYPFFGSSPQVVVGPDIAISLLVASAIVPLAAGDPVHAAALAAMIALFTGVLLLLGAAARFGAVADLLSKPVLVGYMTGAALILICSQADKFFGLHLRHTDFFPRLFELLGSLGKTHSTTLWLGLGSFATIFILKKISTQIPAGLVVMLAALALSHWLDLPARGVAVVGTFPHGLPGFVWPTADWHEMQTLLPAAIGIALLTYTEGILLARAFAAKNSYEVNANQELAALGLANFCGGLFQGFAVTGSQSRTSVSDANGGKSPVVSWISAAALIVFILVLAPFMAKLPTVALAAILVYGGFALLDFKSLARIYRFNPRSGLVAIVTILAVLAAGVITGIMIGVTLSLIGLINRISRPPDAVLSEIPGHGFHDVGNQASESLPGMVVYRFYAPLMFSNAGYFNERVEHIVTHTPHPLKWFVLDAQAITDLDVTAADTLRGLHDGLADKGIALKVVHANRPFREVMVSNGLMKILGTQCLFDSVHECAVAFAKESNETDKVKG